jgi:hypothetical protein
LGLHRRAQVRGPVQFERRIQLSRSSRICPAADRDTSPANLRGGVPVAWVGRLRVAVEYLRNSAVETNSASQDPVEGKGPRADRHSRQGAHEGPTTARTGAFVSRQRPALGEDKRRSISSGSATWARLGAVLWAAAGSHSGQPKLPKGVSSTFRGNPRSTNSHCTSTIHQASDQAGLVVGAKRSANDIRRGTPRGRRSRRS